MPQIYRRVLFYRILLRQIFKLEAKIDRFNYEADGYSLLVDKTIFLSSEIKLEATE